MCMHACMYMFCHRMEVKGVNGNADHGQSYGMKRIRLAQQAILLEHMVNILIRTTRLEQALGHQALRRIYKGAIEPMLTYRAPVQIEAPQKQKNRQTLQKIQLIMNIEIKKAHKTTSLKPQAQLLMYNLSMLKFLKFHKSIRHTRHEK